MSEKRFTIVTSLLDINRGNWNTIYRRDINSYFLYLSHLLNLECNFYIYMDSRYVDHLNKLIKLFQKDLSTVKIVPINMDELYMYKYYDKIKSIMKDESRKNNISDKDCPELINPEYNIVVNSKVNLVYRASLDNVFNSTHFIWIDAGYGHGKIDIPFTWYPNKLLTDKIEVLCLRDITEIDSDYKIFFDRHIDIVNGGIFSCNIDNIKKYNELYYTTIDKCINEKNITDDDQYTVSMIIKHNTELFNIHINKDWYCAFNIF
jgi:protein YibB